MPEKHLARWLLVTTRRVAAEVKVVVEVAIRTDSIIRFVPGTARDIQQVSATASLVHNMNSIN